ncbi:MAG: hypothetical protein EZS28_038138 [Streblomastix strix]|uniref:Uncharacterized protein n=1 Tax=Streblomastix strix TaxID=222440 RepID=A0A5J4U667_9EUKA|nr:MAG: hypothetical protein EZS28_038138 [Streblomastix strix]
MSNVITTLGTATGGSNAITDISIDGNILIPTKNKNFVDTDYDQSISGQKTFNTTIHSVGIMVQTYDNSSVVCASGGVRSIADIQSVSYSKSEDYALLLLKADKTQLIGSYTKGETNNLLNSKEDTGVSYTKRETNNLINNKADTGVSYTKGEEDAFLLLKADKSTTYNKTEDDALLLLKADKTQLIDSYTKETDYIIYKIDAEDVDLTDSYNITKTDELLGDNADATELSINVTGSPYAINYGSDPPTAKKLDRSSYELKFNFIGAFENGGTNISVYSPIGIRYANGTGS